MSALYTLFGGKTESKCTPCQRKTVHAHVWQVWLFKVEVGCWFVNSDGCLQRNGQSNHFTIHLGFFFQIGLVNTVLV